MTFQIIMYSICLNVFNISYKANETNNMCFKWIGDLTIRTKLEDGNYDHHIFKPNETWICSTKRVWCPRSDRNLLCYKSHVPIGLDAPKIFLFNDFIRCFNTIRIMIFPPSQPKSEMLSRLINQFNSTIAPDIMIVSSLALPHDDFPRCKDYGTFECKMRIYRDIPFRLENPELSKQ
uniref:Uncharacterized protein n=1 Tax=Romanomermis culicivorax TaxID=13658 RepID=A0A915KW43_ROMCU